jgi:hypothetical protein
MANKIIQTDMPFPVFSMEADTDYLLARLVNFLGSSFHSRAGFFAQQACEKYMKALSVQRDQSYRHAAHFDLLRDHRAALTRSNLPMAPLGYAVDW